MTAAGAAVIHESIPRVCGFCGGRLGSKRAIIPNRRRQCITFLSAFCGVIGYFASLFTFAAQSGTSGPEDLLTFFNVMRWAGLLIGVVATSAYFLARNLPDTVHITCSVCRKKNTLLVRFKGPAT